MSSDAETPVPEADAALVAAEPVAKASAPVVEPEAAPVAEEPQVVAPEPAEVVEHPANPEIMHVDEPLAQDPRAAHAQRIDAFVANARQAVADGLAAQPFHGTTVMFDDLICVANAIIESLAAEMRG